MKEKFLVFLGRLGSSLYFRLHLYRAISKFYQFFFERRRETLYQYRDLAELVSTMRTLKWRADTWRQLWDTISHPEHVQWLANNDPGRFIGDCDDHASYEAQVFTEQFQGSRWQNLTVFGAEILTVMWRGEKYGGHNVCLIKLLDGESKPFYCYMDYGWPSKIRSTVQEVVKDVMDKYAPTAVSLGWARNETPTLKPLEVSWK
jgi:hypothetical protein